MLVSTYTTDRAPTHNHLTVMCSSAPTPVHIPYPQTHLPTDPGHAAPHHTCSLSRTVVRAASTDMRAVHLQRNGGWGSKLRRVVQRGRQRETAEDGGSVLAAVRVYGASRHEQETPGATGSNSKQ